MADSGSFLCFVDIITLLASVSVVGFALQRILQPDLPDTLKLLNAPIIGFSSWAIPTFWLARIGIPLRFAGAGILLAATLSAVIYLAFFRRRLVGTSLVLAVPPLLCLLIFSIPLLYFGYNYIAFANGDWGFYQLGAQALFQRGFGMPNPPLAFLTNSDYSTTFTLLLWTTGRQGAEILIADTMSYLRISDPSSYLVLLVISQVLIALSAMQLVWLRGQSLLFCVIGGIAAATSPLMSYAFTLQLLPQDLGIALAAVNATLLFPTEETSQTNRAFRPSMMLVAITIAAQFLVYPELLPFLGLGVALQAFIALARRDGYKLRQSLLYSGAAFIGGMLLIAPAVRNAIVWVLAGATKIAPAKVAIHQTALYPSFIQLGYFLDYWGVHQVGSALPEYGLALTLLALSILLTIALVYAASRLALRYQATALVTIPMLVLAARFFAVGDDFASFKLAMYSEVFSIATLCRWAVLKFSK